MTISSMSPFMTVGCWIQDAIARADGSYPILFKGDDGWFEANYQNPLHGTYDAIYRHTAHGGSSSESCR